MYRPRPFHYRVGRSTDWCSGREKMDSAIEAASTQRAASVSLSGLMRGCTGRSLRPDERLHREMRLIHQTSRRTISDPVCRTSDSSDENLFVWSIQILAHSTIYNASLAQSVELPTLISQGSGSDGRGFEPHTRLSFLCFDFLISDGTYRGS